MESVDEDPLRGWRWQVRGLVGEDVSGLRIYALPMSCMSVHLLGHSRLALAAGILPTFCR